MEPWVPASGHPYSTAIYAESHRRRNVVPLAVPPWGTHVLLQRTAGRGSPLVATGLYPWTSLDPGCDLAGGLRFLKDQGIASVTILTDPVWCPPLDSLQSTFAVCRPLKPAYIMDRSIGSTIRKRHRNRINNANRLCRVHQVGFAEYIDEWWNIYSRLVDRKDIAETQRVPRESWETIAELPGLVSFAAFEGGTLLAISLWIRYRDAAGGHFTACTDRGYEILASYACYARALSYFHDCRLINFGGRTGVVESETDGLAEFKRGFANVTRTSYLCASAWLTAAREPRPSSSQPSPAVATDH
ncbi:MAG: hypothetical protein U0790_22810 [Isosphaeraceae bacterium]